MKRLPAGFQLLPFVIHAQTRRRNFFISVDGDGVPSSFVPRVARADAHNVKGSFRDMVEITKLLQVLTGLETP